MYLRPKIFIFHSYFPTKDISVNRFDLKVYTSYFDYITKKVFFCAAKILRFSKGIIERKTEDVKGKGNRFVLIFFFIFL